MDEDIPPLPEGWTPERVWSTDPMVIAELPDEIYLAISAWTRAKAARTMAENKAKLAARAAEDDRQRAAAGLKIQRELDLELTLRMGMPESQLHTELWDVAKIFDYNGDQAWGFVVVKTWGYGADGPRWSQYWTSLSARIEKLLRETGVGPDGDVHSGIAGKFRMILIEDGNALNGASETVVRDYLRSLLDDNEAASNRFPEGVNRDLILVATEKASNSLLSPKGQTPPWLLAVLMEGDELEDEEEIEDDSRPAVQSWKTSIDSLVELWQCLQRQPADELEAFEGKIWQGVMDDNAEDEAEDDV